MGPCLWSILKQLEAVKAAREELFLYAPTFRSCTAFSSAACIEKESCITGYDVGYCKISLCLLCSQKYGSFFIVTCDDKVREVDFVCFFGISALREPW